MTKAHNIVLGDYELNMREVTDAIGISKTHVGHLLHEIFGIKKLSVRRLSGLLNLDNKRNHANNS